MTNILTVNPGSTAVKYVLFDNIGNVLEQRVFDKKEDIKIEDKNKERSWLESLNKDENSIEKISIRIVHGGDMHGPLELDIDIKMQIKRFARFAPIHNNLALSTINLLREVIPNSKIIVSFDSDFHKTMSKVASTYPISASLTQDLDIKRYGFHGLAVQSVLRQLKIKLGRLPERVICAHLGGGCSITAVKDGKSVDTTMGLTPLEGLMMITRSGSIGPGVVEYISESKGWSIKKVIDMLNNESGFYGMTGSKNTLDIIDRASKRQEPEKLAFDIFVSKIVKQIFAYYGTIQGCDALIISGGIGYGNTYLRSKILESLSIIGISEENTFVIKADEARVLFENTKKV